MKYKFLFGILTILLLMSVVGAKSVDDLTNDDLTKINYFVKDTGVEFDGFNFTIPAGYGYLEGFDANETEDGVTSSSEFFVSKEYKVIMLSTLSGDINLDINNYNIYDGKKEIINDHEGWLSEYNDYKYFVFIDNDKIIILQSPEDDDFELMIAD